ncbi:hypothetical protein BDW74DRAFT_33957 [Aspergillus multicolor]|uniref:uncharacterized protein n=1 Tax=Aspergillus multicolor TaxID=41759 RepID=UPI003CCE4314
MDLQISPIKAEDVQLLVRNVEYPAHQDNPLYLLMFPRSKSKEQEASHEQQREQTPREDEIKWMVDGTLETVCRGDETLYKACTGDGVPVGLIGWTTNPGRGASAGGKDMDGREGAENARDAASKSKTGHGRGAKVKSEVKDSWCPSSLDVAAWLGVSKRLRKERARVLQSYQSNPMCRITSLVVAPGHQK